MVELGGGVAPPVRRDYSEGTGTAITPTQNLMENTATVKETTTKSVVGQPV